MKNLSDLKLELLKDSQTRDEYDALKTQFAVASQIIEIRKKKGLTQKQLADCVGTKQAAIARMESGKYNPSVQLLSKVARALGAHLILRLE